MRLAATFLLAAVLLSGCVAGEEEPSLETQCAAGPGAPAHPYSAADLRERIELPENLSEPVRAAVLARVADAILTPGGEPYVALTTDSSHASRRMQDGASRESYTLVLNGTWPGGEDRVTVSFALVDGELEPAESGTKRVPGAWLTARAKAIATEDAAVASLPEDEKGLVVPGWMEALPGCVELRFSEPVSFCTGENGTSPHTCGTRKLGRTTTVWVSFVSESVVRSEVDERR